jgi:hypothetical protein
MTTIQATIKGRRLEFDVPADWPDGLQVEIYPSAVGKSDVDEMSSEEIARTLAAMDCVTPLDITDEERIEWDAARKARQEREKARFAEHAEELRRGWE